MSNAGQPQTRGNPAPNPTLLLWVPLILMSVATAILNPQKGVPILVGVLTLYGVCYVHLCGSEGGDGDE